MPFITNQQIAALKKLVLANAYTVGFNVTEIEGLSVVKRTRAGEKRSFNAPYAALVLQGRKRTLVGPYEHTYGPGECVVTCLDFPSVTYIEEASEATPFLSVVLHLDRVVLTELAHTQDQCRRSTVTDQPFVVARSSKAVAEAFLRLLTLNGDTEERRLLLAPILTQELYAELLLSEQGPWIRDVCAFGSRSHQVAAAIDFIKAAFRHPITIDTLAKKSGMSPATLHRHFKTLTGFSPIQYQKILRLYAAQRQLVSGRQTVSGAAYDVGYVSSSQFSHDYKAFFGLAPKDDVRRCDSV